MNISKQALLAAEVAGDEAYAHGGAPEDVAEAAVKAAARFIAAQALREAAEDVNCLDDADLLTVKADGLVGK